MFTLSYDYWFWWYLHLGLWYLAKQVNMVTLSTCNWKTTAPGPFQSFSVIAVQWITQLLFWQTPVRWIMTILSPSGATNTTWQAIPKRALTLRSLLFGFLDHNRPVHLLFIFWTTPWAFPGCLAPVPHLVAQQWNRISPNLSFILSLCFSALTKWLCVSHFDWWCKILQL